MFVSGGVADRNVNPVYQGENKIIYKRLEANAMSQRKVFDGNNDRDSLSHQKYITI